MSGAHMKVSKFGSRHENGRLFRRAAPTGLDRQVAGHSLRTVLNLNLFGPGAGAGAAISLSRLISFFLQAAHFGAPKGVI